MIKTIIQFASFIAVTAASYPWPPRSGSDLELFPNYQHLAYGMPNVCERKAVHFRREWKLCRKSRPGPIITYRSENCTGSEEEDGKGCLRRDRKTIYYDTLVETMVPQVTTEASCCRGWYRLAPTDFGCPYRTCDGGQCGMSSLCRPGAFGHRCKCRPGLQGKLCNIDVDECTWNNGGCHEQCQNTFGSYFCSCQPPKNLAPDGLSCVTLDKTQLVNSSNSSDYDYETTTVMTLVESPNQLPVFSSCNVHNGGCAHICRSLTAPTVTCECLPGFRLAEDGRSCEDIDECIELNSDNSCEEICQNTIGSFQCRCYQGRKLDTDGITCIDAELESVVKIPRIKHFKQLRGGGSNFPFAVIDYERDVAPLTSVEALQPLSRCNENNGGCQQICQDSPIGAVCSCRPGYELDKLDSTRCLDVDECQSGTHCCAETCFNTEGSFKCQCKAGFRLAPDGCGCIDIDECTENVTMEIIEGVVTTSLPLCDHICVNTDGSYRCACRPGFQLSPLDKATCFRDFFQNTNSTPSNVIDITLKQVEASDLNRKSSKIRIESIAFVPKLRPAVPLIIDEIDSPNMQDNCSVGFYGSDCSLTCVPCRHDAPCDRESGACNCPPGTSGDLCEVGCPKGMYGPPDCSKACPSNCMSGECDAELGYCQCQPGYFGPTCIECPDGRYGQNCEGECDCSLKHSKGCNATTGECICEAGYTGAGCESPCEPGYYDDCSTPCPVDCSLLCDPASGNCPNTNCSNGYYGDSCNLPCPPGQYGSMCATYCDDCSPYGCDPVTGQCVCPPGKTGSQCREDCPFGYFGSDCSQQCNCSVLMSPIATGGFQFATQPDSSIPVTNLQYLGLETPANGLRHESVGCDPATGSCYCPVGTTFSSDLQRCQPCRDGFFGPNCAQKCECDQLPPREFVPSPIPEPAEITPAPTTVVPYFRNLPENSTHLSKRCHVVSGECLCEPGWRGEKCNKRCSAGSYGQNCLHKCTCSGHSDDCRPTDGRCVCLTGWTGDQCHVPCQQGRYGVNCSQTCDCRHPNATCDRFLGTCICPPGYVGVRCEDKCPRGFHGRDCEQRCNCGYKNCHHVSGICLESPSMEEIDISTQGRVNQESLREKKIRDVSAEIQASGDTEGVSGEDANLDKLSAQVDVGSDITKSPEIDRTRDRIIESMVLGDKGSTSVRTEEPFSKTTEASTTTKLSPSTSTKQPRRASKKGRHGGEKSDRRRSSNEDTEQRRRNSAGQKKSVAFRDDGAIKKIVESEQLIAAGDSPCPAGYYGPACQDICPCYANGTCDSTGQCRCRPGRIGPLCEHGCPPGYFGKDCGRRCRCVHSDSKCNPETGKCDCATGYTGKICSKPCPPGWYGRNCAEPCSQMNCSREGAASCDRNSGKCTCNSGYSGELCSEICPVGSYGPHCSLKCTCENGGICDHVTGCCTCPPGYGGTLCEVECQDGFFGSSCSKSCSGHCRSGQCDPVTGKCIPNRQAVRDTFASLRRRYGTTRQSADRPPTSAALVGPAETRRSIRNSARSIPNSLHHSSPYSSPKRTQRRNKCEPYHYGPDCSLNCNCAPPPASKGCDKRNGRCRCQKGYVGPYCERKVDESNGLAIAGRADVLPNFYQLQQSVFDASSSLSSSTEHVLQQVEDVPLSERRGINSKAFY